jgi:predicted RNase H-like HicB family nuclease
MYFIMSGNTDVIPFLYIDVLEYSEERTFVAECLEIPVIVEADTLEKVESKMKLAIEGFFEVFPEERTTVLNKRRIPVPNRPEVIPSGDRIVLKIVMPQG